MGVQNIGLFCGAWLTCRTRITSCVIKPAVGKKNHWYAGAALLAINIQQKTEMPVSCCAYRCTKCFIKGEDTGFFRIPQDPERRRLWVLAMRRQGWSPNEHSRICSNHFVKGNSCVAMNCKAKATVGQALNLTEYSFTICCPFKPHCRQILKVTLTAN